MKLDVIPRILDETLRLWSPIPGIGLTAYEDTVLGGRYPVAKGQKISVLLAPLHTHPGAWQRPEEFDIDRWLPDRKAEHHPHAYKPFGNGERACIGRQFALTEARLALALLLQKFALSDPHSYRMHVKQTLTIKPEGFTVRVRERRPHERAAPAALSTMPASPVPPRPRPRWTCGRWESHCGWRTARISAAPRTSRTWWPSGPGSPGSTPR